MKEPIQRRPSWLKVSLPKGEAYQNLKSGLRKRTLYTVCEEASCPNLSECWAAKTATVMVLGDTCTRACKFCHVKTGNPQGLLDVEEPQKTAEMVAMMNLRYVVVTSVDRDDLPDFGSSHFAQVVKAIHQHCPQTKVEVLIPDFQGVEAHMHTLAKSAPLVIAQNVETVKRLTHPVRDRRASYECTLETLAFYKQHYPHISTKTSLMVGLGETFEELKQTLMDLRKKDVDIVTFGQYLQPTQRHLKVERFYTPAEFEYLKELSYALGFKFVASGPLVRSSYKAADYLSYLEAKGLLT